MRGLTGWRGRRSREEESTEKIGTCKVEVTGRGYWRGYGRGAEAMRD